MAVVYRLEAVHVDEQHADRQAIAQGPGQAFAQLRLQQPPVGQAGQPVVIGPETRQRLGRFTLLHLLPQGFGAFGHARFELVAGPRQGLVLGPVRGQLDVGLHLPRTGGGFLVQPAPFGGAQLALVGQCGGQVAAAFVGVAQQRQQVDLG
jgi:hypothetical protein